MGYTASDSIARVKLKGFISTSGSLTDPEVLAELNDALRSDVIPFLKAVRDEWFVSGSEDVQLTSNTIPMPNSVGSTIRRIVWLNNGNEQPLSRIEPENAFAYSNGSSNVPAGYMLKGYEIRILPNNVGSQRIRIEWMERPAEMVLEEDAGLIESHTTLALTLASVPLAWQSTAPTTVDLISNESPFQAVAEDVTVLSLVGNVLTLSGVDPALVEDGFWVADVGCSPYPNVPIELHPLLQQHVICVLGQSFGDKRLKGWQDRLMQLEANLRKTLAPRTQGSPRAIVNRTGPGMRTRGRGYW